MTIYTENGFKNRKDYLECMSEDYGVPYETVTMLADLNGRSEDFDGLITILEDYSDDM